MQLVLRSLGEPFEEEFRFAAPERQWRADFRLLDHPVLIEVEGGQEGTSRHRSYYGFPEDCVKYNHAAMLGWRVYRFTSEQVKDGTAREFLERAL
jgi:very-short-patch-repair endonuclease